MKSYPPAVRRLLLSTVVFVMGRSVGMPYLAIYLTERMQVSAQTLGWLLGGSVFFATVFGLYAGYLADQFSKRKLLLAACAMMALACVGVTVTTQLVLVFAALCCVEAAVTMQKIALKALLADWLAPTERAKAFSMNYTLTNVAFSLGPVVGAWAFGMEHAAPLWLSAGFALMASQVVTHSTVKADAGSQGGSAPVPSSFKDTLRDLRNDHQLVWLTLGGVLAAFVFGRFVTGYLSQYLIQTQGIEGAAHTMPAILLTNALVVILLQYPVGRKIAPPHLFRWVAAGVAFYVLGLWGFMHANSVLTWVLATAAFTVGEVITIPTDYLFVDRIAPAHKRGSYYGAQGLSLFGASLSPVVCGYLLASYPPAVMFWVLIAAAVASLWFYYQGARPQPGQVFAAV
ncbi:MFS transporter [Rhodoferax aquaticus]|uniref:MFS transporter n=1 Tax=Rhodoferax aquaticus TaxID=2527691 RepID=A0A515EUK5_9BURK|nr:MFS transporter [Rhodoferax aquaticus]QDL56318.1 MFS transporter [Rhodoferax aquaticus]